MLTIEKKEAAAIASDTRQPLTPRWLKMPAAVAYSGICRSTIYELLNAGKIDSKWIKGTGRLIDVGSLDAYISAQPSGF